MNINSTILLPLMNEGGGPSQFADKIVRLANTTLCKIACDLNPAYTLAQAGSAAVCRVSLGRLCEAPDSALAGGPGAAMAANRDRVKRSG
eukprot:3694789-Rhodomonas_salina.1